MNSGKGTFYVCKEDGEYTVRNQIERYQGSDIIPTAKDFETVSQEDYWIDAMVKKTELATGVTMEKFFRRKEYELTNMF